MHFLRSFWYFIKKNWKKSIAALVILIVITFFFWPKPKKPIATQTVKKADIIASLSATGTVSSDTSVKLTFPSAGKLVYLGAKKGDHLKKGQTIAILDQRTVQNNLETALRNYSEQRNTFDQTSSDNQNRTPNQALNDTMKRILQDNQYDLDKAVLSVELQDLAKQQSVLTSPIDGIMIAEDVTTTNQFTIADPSNITFDIDIDEADIGKVKIGQQVKINLDAYPDKELILVVKSIDFAAHTTSTGGNVYTVEVRLPNNKNLDYRIGMNGDAEIITDERKNVLNIPLSSITDDQHVYVKTDKGFEKRKIETGLTNDTDAEVTSGLTQDEQVALDPTEAEKEIKK